MQYRGRKPTNEEYRIYGSAPRERLMTDLSRGYDPTAQYVNMVDDLSQEIPQTPQINEDELRSLAEAEYGPYYTQLTQSTQADWADRQKAHDLALKYLEEDKTRGLGRLQEDYTTGIDNLRRNINSRGLYYSGERTNQEGLATRDYERSQADLNRAYERGTSSENLQFGSAQRSYDRSTQDLERQRKYDTAQFMEQERQRKRAQSMDMSGYGALGY